MLTYLQSCSSLSSITAVPTDWKKTRKKTNTKGLRKMSFDKQLVKYFFSPKDSGAFKVCFRFFSQYVYSLQVGTDKIQNQVNF